MQNLPTHWKAMAVSGHLLILLIPVLSLCGATEYYVRPTEPTNISCPAQPCLILSQYINESDHFLKSNTSFKFLPGTHHMDQPLAIRNVQNMSLENCCDERPHLVIQFSCETEKDDHTHAKGGISDECCAAVSLHDVYNVTFRGISVTVQSSEVSALILKNVSKGIVELVTALSSHGHTCHGILLQNTNFIEVHSFSARNFTHGLTLHNTIETRITNAYAAHNKKGFVFKKTADTYISNSTATHNHRHGMLLQNMINTNITNISTMYNGAGMDIQTLTDTHITNTIATRNHWLGISLHNMRTTHITNTRATHNGGPGVSLSHTIGTYITSTTAKYNKKFGIGGSSMVNTYIASTTATANTASGLYFCFLFNTHIVNTISTHNQYGLVLNMTVDTYISNSAAAHNHLHGMLLRNMSDTNISNTTTMYNKAGMHLQNLTDTHITNTIATRNHWFGISLDNLHNTHITNTRATHNGDTGVSLTHTIGTYITSTTAKYNKKFGIGGSSMVNTYIASTTATENQKSGMDLKLMKHTSIVNAIASHNGWVGVYLRNMTSTHITNLTAMHNRWVGVYLRNMTSTHITNLTAMHNSKKSRKVYVNGQSEIAIYSSSYTHISNSSFTDSRLSSIASTAAPDSIPAVVEVYYSSLFFSECQFVRNLVSAVRAYASNITLSGDLVFSGNKAIAGTAFVLLHNSILIFVENSHTYFTNNHAINNGGVFYIVNNPYFGGLNYAEPFCFLKTEGKRSQIWLTFVNNSAGKGGDILYGGDVALGLDGDWNCLDSFRDISNISQNGPSLISSDPSRICLCKQSGQPDCLLLADPHSHIIYPGQTLSICAVVVGQEFGTVAGTVYAQFIHRSSNGSPPQLESWQKGQSVSQHECSHLYCNNLQYTIFSQSEGSQIVLVLSAEDTYVTDIVTKRDIDTLYTIYQWKKTYHTSAISPLMYMNSPVYVHISILPCPLGFVLTTDPPFRCDCNLLLRLMHGIQCYIQDQTIGRSGLLWVGMIHDDNGSNGTIAASEYCSLDYCKREESNVTLSEPDSQCNYNHSGTLCGGCQPGLSLALGSAQCLPCSNKYLALLISLALAGPMLVVFVKILDLTISQGTINGPIFYANVVKANEYILLPQGQTNPLTVFIAWLNLDLGVETCFFQGLSSYSKTWLQFVFPFYIWSIAGFIIILAKLSDRVARMMGNNSVQYWPPFSSSPMPSYFVPS